MTPSRLGRRYLPFIAVAAVQVLLVAVAPSRGPLTGPSEQAVAGGLPSGGNPGAPGSSGATLVGGTGGAAGSAATGSAGGGSFTTTIGSVAAGGGGPDGGSAGGVQDLSRCDPRTGKEIGPLTDAATTNWLTPPCAPVFHGQNGGATMTGVTATAINYVEFQVHGDPTFNATTAAAGLGATSEQWCEAQQAFHDEIQKRWELWGRKLVSLDGPGANKGSAQQSPCRFPYFQSQCNAAPPDEPCYRAEAKVIASMKPAIVLGEVVDPTLYDELTKDHILVFATATAPVPPGTYAQAAPYEYGLFMDGTRQAIFDAGYWCRKLNNKPAIHAGSDITTTRNWGPVPGTPPTRKVAVIFPEDADNANKANVDLFAKLVSGGQGSMCNSPSGVFEFAYSQDVSQSSVQTQTAVNEMVQKHITTIMCWCDLLAPAFLTNTAFADGYFPEYLLPGEGLLDVDGVGRLYNQAEWAHAFGVSDVGEMGAYAGQDMTRAWQDTGHSGQPDNTEGLPLYLYLFMGDAFMGAGPSPTVASIHQGLVALGTNGGWAKLHDPHVIEWGLDQQSPWTFAQDVREVYWSQSRTSAADGKTGSYCPVAGGRRYNLGEFAAGDPDVFDTKTNGC